jgi:thiol-disulfide isomerase/thioredoxin
MEGSMTVLVTLILAAAAPAQELSLGEPLPAFTLPGVDGKPHADTEYAGAKVLALLFTCNHCPTAQAYEERIAKLEADYRDRGVTLVAISPNDARAVRLDELGYTDLGDSLEEMKLRARERGWTFPYLYDGETQGLSRALGVKATPQLFLFDAARKLRYTGAIDDAEVGEVKVPSGREALEDLLAGREVRAPRTRVFGCSTKWSDKRKDVAAADEKWAREPVTLAPADAAAVKALAANAGEQWLLLNVWSTTCAPCTAEFPELVVMQRMYGKRPFRLATICVDPPDNGAAALEFLKKTQAAGMTNLHYAGADKNALAEALDPAWEGPIPHTLLVAPGGKVVWRKTGELDARELKRQIADRLGRTYASRKQ